MSTPADWAEEGLFQGDCRERLRDLEENAVDSLVTDPPYGIGFMGRTWDTFTPGAEQARTVANRDAESDNPNVAGRQRSPAASPSAVEYNRTLAGQREFQAWTESWAREALRVLKPGGYAVVFGAPRSFHRMMSGLEDAGFEVRDTLCWLFGQGFPKSLNVARAVAAFEASGRSRPEDLRRLAMGDEYTPSGRGRVNYDHGSGSVMNGKTITADAAACGAGWGTALKPAWEPIVLARKPLAGLTVAECFLRYGTGGINIGGCRIGSGEDIARDISGAVLGRWPANVALDEAAAQALDDHAGALKSGARSTSTVRTSERTRGVDDEWPGDGTQAYPVDVAASTGGPSRFYYCSKVSRAEREFGCGDLPVRSAGEATGGRAEGSAGLNNPRAGAGRSTTSHNAHPTVKPIALMRWLTKLITPAGGTIVDPFVGSGTTGIACALEGFGFYGTDLEAEWLAVAHARIGAWRARALAGGLNDIASREVDVPLPLEGVPDAQP